MAELLYGFDPLCGWCYGVAPAMRRVAADHPDLPVRLVMAGLVSGDRVGPYAAMEGYIPMGTLGEPEDIGHAAMFLASDGARFITGQSIVVDGGQILPEIPL